MSVFFLFGLFDLFFWMLLKIEIVTNHGDEYKLSQTIPYSVMYVSPTPLSLLLLLLLLHLFIFPSPFSYTSLLPIKYKNEQEHNQRLIRDRL